MSELEAPGLLEVRAGAVESFRVPWAIDGPYDSTVDPRVAPAIAVEFALGDLAAAGQEPAPPAAGWTPGAWEPGGPRLILTGERRRAFYDSRTPTIAAAGNGAGLEADPGEWLLWGRLLDGAERIPRLVGLATIH